MTNRKLPALERRRLVASFVSLSPPTCSLIPESRLSKALIDKVAQIVLIPGILGAHSIGRHAT